ncbi:putative Xaa-Pro aminopeptidase [Chaetomium tenue]|uniref:Xaa-Pro aminopeptidase n=1 Tax=Chaetomium tenue TaxID=1854479 RepID=A0ACB7PDX2_9PEZI|nr:putative Xaa-Pro aminopeptidase [Chaetomium globosum]
MEFCDESYDIVDIDEFDALSIELKSGPSSSNSSPSTISTERTSSDSSGRICDHQLNENYETWREGLGKFPAKEHARKVARKLGVDRGIIFLLGQDEKYYEDSDMGPTFRQRRYFYYITGADFHGCAVTYDILRDRLVLWIPRIEPRTVLWFGKVPTPEECKAASDVDSVYYIDVLYEKECPVFKRGQTIHVLHPDQIPPELDHLGGFIRIDAVHLKPAMDAARVIKTDYEIALIRRANAVSSAAHKAVLHNIKRFTNEREIDALFRGYCIAHGAPIQSYPVIAASGSNASTLHYDDNNQPLKNRQLLILDAGAEVHCYASDITRTIPLPGSFTPRAREIYRLVEKMQDECIAQIKPGVRFSALHAHACVVAVAGLLKLGVLRGKEEEILAGGTVAAFFPHGLGHHVGLEVHDVSGRERLLLNGGPGSGGGASMGRENRLRRRVVMKRVCLTPWGVAALWEGAKPEKEKQQEQWLRKNVPLDKVETALTVTSSWGRRGQKLAQGMVVTVEPGIYFCREYIEGYFLNNPDHAQYIDAEVLEKYWDVGGVRIEDDILVTKKGYENLTSAPKGGEMMKCMGEPGLL